MADKYFELEGCGQNLVTRRLIIVNADMPSLKQGGEDKYSETTSEWCGVHDQCVQLEIEILVVSMLHRHVRLW